MDFGAILGAKMELKSMKKRCWKNDEKTMTTKRAKKLNIGAYAGVRPDDFGARGGGRRRGKPLLKISFIVRWDVVRLEVVGCRL